MDFWPQRINQPETRDYAIRILGVNGADPTEQLGPGVAVTRTSEGLYKITWAKDPNVFVGIAGFCFGAATPADLKGYTLVRDTYNTSAFTLEVAVYDSGFNIADLIADQYLDLTVRFTTTALST